MFRQPSFQAGFSFWFQWTLINGAGLAIGMTIRQFLFSFGALATSPIVVGVVLGISVGIAQAFGLGQASRRFGWWVLASAVGWAIGWGLGWSLGWSVVGNFGFTAVFGLIGALAGAIGGIIQWFLLRDKISRAGWWIGANIVGWAVGMFVGISMGRTFGWALAGATSGAITGLALLWILKIRKQVRYG